MSPEMWTILGLLVAGTVTQITRWALSPGRERKEQAGIAATSDLTVAQARDAAEDTEGKRLERTERMYGIIDDLRKRLDRVEDALDAERDARQEDTRKLKVAVQYATAWRMMIPPPRPDIPDDFPTPPH